MTEQSNAELTATAKVMREQMGEEPKPGSILALWFETAAALEAADQRLATARHEAGEAWAREYAAARKAEQKRDEYAAVVEKVRAACDKALAVRIVESSTSQAQDAGLAAVILREALATAPADALREHDAALIEGLADASIPDLTPGLSIKHATGSAIFTWLREKARQRREEQP